MERKLQLPVLAKDERRMRSQSRKPFVEEFLRERGESARRIEQPMHPDCKIVVAIPAYNEDFETIAAAIDSIRYSVLDSQRTGDDSSYRLEPEELEIVIFVNNTQSAADNNTPEYQANTRLLRQLNRMKQLYETDLENMDDDTDDAEIHRARTLARIPIHIVDETHGRPDEGHSVGKVRADMYGIAVARLLKNNQPYGKVVTLDADSAIAPGALVHALRDFDEDPLNDAIGGSYLDYLDPREPQAIETFIADQISEHMVSIARLMVWNAGIFKELADANLELPHVVHTGGSNAIFTAEAYARCLGTPDLQFYEDVALGRRLQYTGKAKQLPTYRVTTSMRPSDRTEGYGLDNARTREMYINEEKAVPPIMSKMIDIVLHTFTALERPYEQFRRCMPEGAESISEKLYNELLDVKRKKKDPIYEAWAYETEAYIRREKIAPLLYSKYPPISKKEFIADVVERVERDMHTPREVITREINAASSYIAAEAEKSIQYGIDYYTWVMDFYGDHRQEIQQGILEGTPESIQRVSDIVLRNFMETQRPPSVNKGEWTMSAQEYFQDHFLVLVLAMEEYGMYGAYCQFINNAEDQSYALLGLPRSEEKDFAYELYSVIYVIEKIYEEDAVADSE